MNVQGVLTGDTDRHKFLHETPDKHAISGECHGHKDGGVACVEGVTEKIFARGMGQAAVRSWLQQARQTGTQSVHGSGDEPKYFLFRLQKIYALTHTFPDNPKPRNTATFHYQRTHSHGFQKEATCLTSQGSSTSFQTRPLHRLQTPRSLQHPHNSDLRQDCRREQAQGSQPHPQNLTSSQEFTIFAL